MKKGDETVYKSSLLVKFFNGEHINTDVLGCTDSDMPNLYFELDNNRFGDESFPPSQEK